MEIAAFCRAFALLTLFGIPLHQAVAQDQSDRQLPSGWSARSVVSSDGLLGQCMARRYMPGGMSILISVNGRGEVGIGLWKSVWNLHPDWAPHFVISVDSKKLRTRRNETKGSWFTADIADPPAALKQLAGGATITSTYEEKDVSASLTGASQAIKFIFDCARAHGSPKVLKALGLPDRSDSYDDAGEKSSGTGFFVSWTGLVLTNAHVVRGCSTIKVEKAGMEPNLGVVLASDTDADLATIATDLVPKQIADWREDVRLGEAVYVFGYPLIGILSTEGNFTSGGVASLTGVRGNALHYQITAPVQPGNSGGPLLDGGGNVVGVVTSKLDALRVAELTKDIPQNINFAVSARSAIAFLRNSRLEISPIPPSIAKKPEEVAVAAQEISVLIRCQR